MENVGERIRKIRKMNNIKQKEFAERVSVSASYISKVESGKETPTEMFLKLIALDFKVSLEWLRDGIGEMKKYHEGFNVFTDEGNHAKYQIMRDFLEKTLSDQTGDNLRNLVQAYSHFVSLVNMPGLNEDNKKNYFEALCSVNDALESIANKSYMLKTISASNNESLLQYKTYVDAKISKIDENIKKALSCYLMQYGKDMTL